MSTNSRAFFERELKILEDESDKDDKTIFDKTCKYPSPSALSIQKKVTKAILELHDVFAKQHHDNFSASYVMDLFYKLVHFTPLSPLTGKDEEWESVDDVDNTEYNTRFTGISRTNKDNSTAIWNDGILFCEPNNNNWFGAKESRVNISFPFSDFARKLYVLKYKCEDKPIADQLKDGDYEVVN